MNEYDIGSAFEAIEQELISSMIRNMDRHRAEETKEGYEWTMWQTEQLKALEKYKKDNQKKYSKQFKDINRQMEGLISEARQKGNMKEEAKILRTIKNGFRNYKHASNSVQAEFFKLNTRKLEALVKATTNDMNKAETAVLRMANDQYRKAIFNAQMYANTGAGTYEKAVDMATKNMLSAGLNCVEYKNGARHTLSDYADMAVRTASKRAYLQGEGEKRQEWGISTVIVAKRGNPCPKCLPFVGKVLIDDVWSNGKASDGKYPLMSTAIKKGLYHPRCKDSHSTYFPGISTADDTWTKEEIDKIDKSHKREIKQQYAERQAKRFGRLAEFSLDKENKKKYAQRCNDWKEQSTKGRIHDTVMDRSVIESADYKRRVEVLDEKTEVLQTIWKEMKEAVQHRSGTKFEDLIFINSKTGEMRKVVDCDIVSAVKPTKLMKKMLKSSEKGSIIAIHNHPGSSSPSLSDIIVARNRKYKYGLIACHNGKIFKYTITGEVNEIIVNSMLARVDDLIYNKSIVKDFDRDFKGVINKLSSLGVELEVL